MKPTTLLSLLCLIFCLTACEDDDDFLPGNDDLPDNVTGLSYVKVDGGNLTTRYNNLITNLNNNANVGIVAQVDHQANAGMVNLELRPTRVVLFGNPRLGTPLMQANQQAGLDLPQKMLFYETEDGGTVVAYNNTDYLARRHGVDTVSTLATMAGALSMLASAGGTDSVTVNSVNVTRGQGIIVKQSAFDIDSTYDNLIGALTANANLRIIAQLDHQANAGRVNLELRPTRLVVFGNPNLGTPLMQQEQSIGIDLPQKMLVYEDADGNTQVAYNDIDFLIDRHDFGGTPEQVATIKGALDMISTAITTR